MFVQVAALKAVLLTDKCVFIFVTERETETTVRTADSYLDLMKNNAGNQ